MAGNSAVFELSDKALISSVLYRPGRAPEQVPLDRIDASAASSGGLLWVGLKDPEPALLEQIGSRLGFSRKALEEIASPHRRPKVVEYEELTLIVAITVEVENLRPSFGDTQILIGKGYLLTIRRGSTASHHELRDLLENSPEFLGRGSDYVEIGRAHV